MTATASRTVNVDVSTLIAIADQALAAALSACASMPETALVADLIADLDACRQVLPEVEGDWTSEEYAVKVANKAESAPARVNPDAQRKAELLTQYGALGGNAGMAKSWGIPALERNVAKLAKLRDEAAPAPAQETKAGPFVPTEKQAALLAMQAGFDRAMDEAEAKAKAEQPAPTPAKADPAQTASPLAAMPAELYNAVSAVRTALHTGNDVALMVGARAARIYGDCKTPGNRASLVKALTEWLDRRLTAAPAPAPKVDPAPAKAGVIINPLHKVPYKCEHCGDTGNPAPCYLLCVACRKALADEVAPAPKPTPKPQPKPQPAAGASIAPRPTVTKPLPTLPEPARLARYGVCLVVDLCVAYGIPVAADHDANVEQKGRLIAALEAKRSR